jgi:hypothetical protein
MLSRQEFRDAIHAGDPLAGEQPESTQRAILEHGSLPSGPVKAAAAFAAGCPASDGVAPADRPYFLNTHANDLAAGQVGQLHSLVSPG